MENSFQNLPLRTHGILRKRWQEDYKSHREWRVPREEDALNQPRKTYMSSESKTAIGVHIDLHQVLCMGYNYWLNIFMSLHGIRMSGSTTLLPVPEMLLLLLGCNFQLLFESFWLYFIIFYLIMFVCLPLRRLFLFKVGQK